MTESAETISVPEGRLRVLMVISRPAGTSDVGYRMIARPLLERLKAVRGQVDLVVLRPPSLDALGKELQGAAEAGEPFQVVHFDGHGAMPGRGSAGSGAPLRFTGPGPEGVLVFEKPGGGPEEVPSSRVAQLLAAARVPVVVLNACQSGAVGKDLEAAVATRLLSAGVASVVAMAYSVYAVAAAEFMAAFYERLFAGGTVTAAVTAGRQRLYQRNRRPSPKGEMPLADWVVPVHYLRRDVRFPQARTERSMGLPPLEQVLDAQRAAASARAGDLDAVGKFVGRDDLFLQLEAAARLQKIVVLHGPGGTGKTELAKAFGLWWRDTGGVEEPGWVFWHSFEPGVASFGLDSVIAQIGLRLYGTDFAQLEAHERRAVLERVLAERRMLLIWDNFETVRSMPDPARATEPLDDAGCADMREFLEHLAAHGRSTVLITSRTAEEWLGEVRRITVGGLAAHEAAEYAEDLLAPYPATRPRRVRRAFGELMEWLDGHPLSMRLILPRLDTAEPEALLEGLKGTGPLPGGESIGEDRTTSLSASISYSFAHLAEATRRLLPAICLLHAVAGADLLEAFSKSPEVPRRFRGATKQDWQEALEDAARVGLLAGIGGHMYLIHPALPRYLAAEWRCEDRDNHGAIREAATQALLTSYASLGNWLIEQISSGDARLAYIMIELERRTLGSLLRYALDNKLWDKAQQIAQPLQDYLDTRGLTEEARAWADRARLATEGPDGTPPPPGTPAGALWLFFAGHQARRELHGHRFDSAERTYQQILTMLEAQPTSADQQHHLALVYHHLGIIASDRGRLDDAADWHRKSLAINEELDDKPEIARTYHQLGSIARQRGQLDKAEDWLRKCLAIREELGDKPGLALTYYQLGLIARHHWDLDEAANWHRRCLTVYKELGDKAGMALVCHELGNVAFARQQVGGGQLDEAEDWYRKSLLINEELGDKPGIALSYYQLGTTALVLGRLDEAENWTRRSLAIREEIDDQPEMALNYHQLGNIADDRGQLDEAEDWYRKSLIIKERLGNKPGMALTFGALGMLAEKRGHPRQALEWMVKGVALFSEFPHPVTGPVPGQLLRLTAQLGTSALEQCWQQVTGSPLPQAIRIYVKDRPGAEAAEEQAK